MLFDRTVKNINRIRQMVAILIKYGFEDVVTNTPLKRLVSASRRVAWLRDERPVFEYNRFERLRMVIEELGPTFIKFAQLLSNRPDLMPEGLIHEFEKLQNNVPAFDTSIAREIFEKETNKKISDVFVYFDDVPVGAASIGQVHRARLHTGEDVVVKIQRPNINVKVTTDLALIREFVRLTENFFQQQGILNPLDVVDAFEESMSKELDYMFEVRHLEQFRKLYKDDEDFSIPKPYKEFSTTKILTSEFISGCKITDIHQLEAWGLSPQEIVEKGLNIYLKQIFGKGFFHADPHPGNILVRPNGTIVLIDFGMVGKITREQRFAFAGVFVSLAQNDGKGMATSLRKLAIDSDIEVLDALGDDLNEMIDQLITLDVDDSGMAEFTVRLQKIIYKYNLKLPGNIFLILRSLAILEGIGKLMYPDLDTLAAVKPYGRKLLAEQFSLDNIGFETSNILSQVSSLFYQIPTEAKLILRKLRRGELNFHVEVNQLDRIVNEVESITNRLSITLIICALLVFSGLSLSVVFPPTIPHFVGISLVSWFGLILTFLLSLILFIMTVRRKNR